MYYDTKSILKEYANSMIALVGFTWLGYTASNGDPFIPSLGIAAMIWGSLYYGVELAQCYRNRKSDEK